jgi:hypothetical protein
MTMAERGPFWTPTNALGFLFALAGLTLGGWAYAHATFTGVTLIACALLLGGGMWLVDSALTRGFVGEVREVAHEIRGVPGVAAVMERAGRRETDPVAVTTEPAPVAASGWPGGAQPAGDEPQRITRAMLDALRTAGVAAPDAPPPAGPPAADAAAPAASGSTDAELAARVETPATAVLPGTKGPAAAPVATSPRTPGGARGRSR